MYEIWFIELLGDDVNSYVECVCLIVISWWMEIVWSSQKCYDRHLDVNPKETFPDTKIESYFHQQKDMGNDSYKS